MKVKRITKKVRSYTAFFDKNKSGVYTVSVPSLPGLVTEGKNMDDARSMAEDAIKCYVQGLQKGHEAIPEENQTAQVRIVVRV